MIDLTLVAKEMRKVARENIFRPGITEGSMTLVSNKTHRDIEYDGFNVGLTFSLDEMPELNIWHLTISIEGQSTPPTNEFVRPFLEAFFGQSRVMELPPEEFPPQMRRLRQFISKV